MINTVNVRAGAGGGGGRTAAHSAQGVEALWSLSAVPARQYSPRLAGALIQKALSCF